MKLFRLGSKNFFRFFSGTFFERKKAIERAEINVDQLSGFMMPSGIISGSALDYLEGENPSEKSYDEIVQIIEQNVTRTTIQSIAMAKRNLFDLLKREIRSVFCLFVEIYTFDRSLDEITQRLRNLEDQYQLVSERQLDQSRIRKSVELTASKSFSNQSRSPRDNSRSGFEHQTTSRLPDS